MTGFSCRYRLFKGFFSFFPKRYKIYCPSRFIPFRFTALCAVVTRDDDNNNNNNNYCCFNNINIFRCTIMDTRVALTSPWSKDYLGVRSCQSKTIRGHRRLNVQYNTILNTPSVRPGVIGPPFHGHNNIILTQ